MELILQPLEESSVGDYLLRILNQEFGKFNSLSMAVAFAKFTGIRHLEAGLRNFAEDGNYLKVIVGIDHFGTSLEALELLLDITKNKGEVWINHSEGDYITFHPKIYLFENKENAIALIGSTNLTEGGLFTNDEAMVVLHLGLAKQEDVYFIEKLKQALTYWSDEKTQNAKRLSQDFIKQLVDNKYILPERFLVESTQNKAQPYAEGEANETVANEPETSYETALFKRSAIKRSAPKSKRVLETRGRRVQIPSDIQAPSGNVAIPETSYGFVMTLQKTDVGTGQTTSGTSRRSPEIFIPLAARDYLPEFWGWQNLFLEDASMAGKFDRTNVRFRIGGEIVLVNMMTWPTKSDFRLRSETLRSAGNIGDILRIEKTVESEEFDYYVEIIPQQTSSYEEYLAICNQRTRNSTRRWGYYVVESN